MAAQLRHLVKLARRRNVTVQIVPNSAGAHAATGFSFTILNRGGDGSNIVYLENLIKAQFLDDPGEVSEHELIFRTVLTSALTPSASIELLGTVASELDNK